MSGLSCYYFFDHNQLVLKELFEESMGHFMPDITLCPIELEYKSQSSDFGTLDFRNIILEKMTKVVDIIKSNIESGTTILVSDIDIIIYDNFERYLNIGDADIMIQKEHRNRKINTGFILIKCSDKTYNYWKFVEEQMKMYKKGSFINEQEIMNNTIAKSGLTLKLFDDTIWAYSNQPMPANICLHHANVTKPSDQHSSLQKKCMQLVSVMNIMNHKLKDRFIPRLEKYY